MEVITDLEVGQAMANMEIHSISWVKTRTFSKVFKVSSLKYKIAKHFENHEFPGWDITSYNLDGSEKFIEVKSTKGNKINQLDITSNEWDAAKREGDKYFIYLVNNALNNEIKIFEMINNPAKLVDENSIDISTSVYELKL